MSEKPEFRIDLERELGDAARLGNVTATSVNTDALLPVLRRLA